MLVCDFNIVQAKAKEQLHTSKNLFVKSVAQLVLKTFKWQAGIPRMKGTPWPA